MSLDTLEMFRSYDSLKISWIVTKSCRKGWKYPTYAQTNLNHMKRKFEGGGEDCQHRRGTFSSMNSSKVLMEMSFGERECVCRMGIVKVLSHFYGLKFSAPF